jgi:hypothetical protein
MRDVVPLLMIRIDIGKTKLESLNGRGNLDHVHDPIIGRINMFHTIIIHIKDNRNMQGVGRWNTAVRSMIRDKIGTMRISDGVR